MPGQTRWSLDGLVDQMLSGEVERSMRAFLADNPRGKHGTHRYELEDFGLGLGEIRERFSAYSQALDVQPTA